MKSKRPMLARCVPLILLATSGFAALLLLFPTAVLHSDPPQCLAMLGYGVPCGQFPLPGFSYAGWALAASITVPVLSGILLHRFRLELRRSPSNPI